jgi:hypothetical protein
MPDPVHEDAGGKRIAGIDQRLRKVESCEGFSPAGGSGWIAQGLQKSGWRSLAGVFWIAADEDPHGLPAALDAGHEGAGGRLPLGDRFDLRLKAGQLLLLRVIQQALEIFFRDKKGCLGILPQSLEYTVMLGCESGWFLVGGCRRFAGG